LIIYLWYFGTLIGTLQWTMSVTAVAHNVSSYGDVNKRFGNEFRSRNSHDVSFVGNNDFVYKVRQYGGYSGVRKIGIRITE